MQRGMVIVGGGECGARAAFELRRCGYRGSITIVSSEKHPPYARPPLSKEFIAAPGPVAPDLVATVGAYNDARIDLVLGSEVVSIDRVERSVQLTAGRKIGFERLLLATGAVARRIRVPGAADRRVVSLRTVDDALRLRRAIRPGTRIMIVGGGFIGLELAASATYRGAAVAIVEASPRVMSRGVPVEIAERATARHQAAGVQLLCADTVARIAPNAEALKVTLASGRLLPVDLVVVAVGVDPATAAAETAGLRLENGVAVDGHLATSDDRIFAAGDCCSFPIPIYGNRRVRLESWRNAVDQGPLAARNMLGAGESVAAIPWFWSEQHDLTLQVAGLCEEGAEIVRRNLTDDAFILFHLDSRRRLVAASGIGPGTAVAKHISLAERLIRERTHPGASELASPEFNLKKLLSPTESRYSG